MKSKAATRQRILPKPIEVSLGHCVDGVPRFATNFHVLKGNHFLAMGICDADFWMESIQFCLEVHTSGKLHSRFER